MADPSAIRPGESYPLGATCDPAGTNFALFSEVATKVELCLSDDDGGMEVIPLPERDGFTWHGYVPGAGPGQRYRYRVHGPYDPAAGHRCDPSKLLLDPYALAIDGGIDWNPAVFSYRLDAPDERNESDSAWHVPSSVVVDRGFDWGSDRPPRTPPEQTVLYEAHVRGLTRLHPDVPDELRGSYLGLAQPAVTGHLRALGVTAIELLPVQQFVSDSVLAERGLSNYWGYNTIGFFAPHHGYAAGGSAGAQVHEFKSMVKALHEAGIEVILDVVYNHTGEGNHFGPTLCFRGIDNAAYYRLAPDDPRYYMDTTGTGNSLHMRHPQVLQLIMDSLRYWVTQMHVDGFRFDLAATLARSSGGVDLASAFLAMVQQDPVVSQVKLIAEPWDTGDGGYQVGRFPPLWAEWNDKYRDCVRDFWCGKPVLRELATRLTGSSDLYQHSGRRPAASVNFITCHDGFTLTDLVSYEHKHNEANGDGNQDGNDDNRSWNCGAEGPVDDPGIVALRDRQRRNFLATLLLSQGIPMLLAGDELGRTQRGSNNAYCQDNEISWVSWATADQALIDFTRRLIGLRRDHPAFRRRRFLTGKASGDRPGEQADIAWYRSDGAELTGQDWDAGSAPALTVFLNGAAIGESDGDGLRIEDDSFLLLFNAAGQDVTVTLPLAHAGQAWLRLIDTTAPPAVVDQEVAIEPGDQVELAGHSLQVLLLKN